MAVGSRAVAVGRGVAAVGLLWGPALGRWHPQLLSGGRQRGRQWPALSHPQSGSKACWRQQWQPCMQVTCRKFSCCT